MLKVRQFKLINSHGEEWDLMRRDTLFYTPDGLGFQMENQYFKIGNSFQTIDTDSVQKVVAGIMVFDSYDLYAEFARFVSYTPMKLAYKPREEWAYLDGSITKLEKTEIDYTDRKLKCAVDFTGTSKWYIPRRAIETGSESENGKQYTYHFDYVYSDSANSTINIVNDSTEDSPCIISIFGPIENPTWQLLVGSNVVQSGSVSGTVPSGNKLVINSNDNNLEIMQYTTSDQVVANRYQDSDFTRENFIYVPPGKSTLFISGDNGDGFTAWIEVHEIHETI